VPVTVRGRAGGESQNFLHRLAVSLSGEGKVGALPLCVDRTHGRNRFRRRESCGSVHEIDDDAWQIPSPSYRQEKGDARGALLMPRAYRAKRIFRGERANVTVQGNWRVTADDASGNRSLLLLSSGRSTRYPCFDLIITLSSPTVELAG
jgi:hypothetical protein